jgi:hypothetical protein
MSRAFFLLLTCALMLVAAKARAHTVGISQSDFTVDSSGVHARLVFAKTEAIRFGHDEDELRRTMEAGVLVMSDHAPCKGALREWGTEENDGLGMTMDFACAAPHEVVDVDMRVLGQLGAAHRHALRISAGSLSSEVFLSADARVASLTLGGAPAAQQTPPPPLWKAIELGTVHILSGWDHLLFLLALLFGTRGRREIVLAVSAFTVAHSITLALAALDVVTPDPRWVECAIAASIAYVAYENVLRAQPVHRWRVTAAFGLIHGFGFAGALRDLGLAGDRLLPTLLGFNVGVEAGQLAVVLVLWPLLTRLRRLTAFETRWLRALSIAIGITGVVLFALRLAAA